MPNLLTPEEAERVVADKLVNWSYQDDSLVRSVVASSFAAGIELVAEVAHVAEELDHHPDIDIRWTTITFRLSTHSAGGVTDNDVELAERIDAIAAS